MSDYKLDAVLKTLILLAAMAIGGLIIYKEAQYQDRYEPKVLTQEQVQQPETVAREIHVTQPAAQTIVREIETLSGQTPAVTYYVQAPTIQKAAESAAKQIESKDKSLPATAVEKSDRTIVAANDKEQKVDVYKINLRKAHKLKAGASYIYDKSYFTAGYQAGKVEGLVYFDWTGKPKGGSVLYTVFEW